MPIGLISAESHASSSHAQPSSSYTQHKQAGEHSPSRIQHEPQLESDRISEFANAIAKSMHRHGGIRDKQRNILDKCERSMLDVLFDDERKYNQAFANKQRLKRTQILEQSYARINKKNHLGEEVKDAIVDIENEAGMSLEGLTLEQLALKLGRSVGEKIGENMVGDLKVDTSEVSKFINNRYIVIMEKMKAEEESLHAIEDINAERRLIADAFAQSAKEAEEELKKLDRPLADKSENVFNEKFKQALVTNTPRIPFYIAAPQAKNTDMPAVPAHIALNEHPAAKEITTQLRRAGGYAILEGIVSNGEAIRTPVLAGLTAGTVAGFSHDEKGAVAFAPASRAGLITGAATLVHVLLRDFHTGSTLLANHLLKYDLETELQKPSSPYRKA